MTLLPTELPPFGGLRSPKGHLPLVAMHVRAEIAGLLATTTVRQTFRNALDEHLEATYVFPLPDRAGVTAFVATLGGRRVEGVLKERQAARDDYDAAIAEGKRAALLEEDRPGVFSAKVGNIAPGEEAEVKLVLTGPLPYDQGEAAFRFPLVVAPRYVPGQPLEGPGAGDGTALDTDLVPDASRITPPVLLPGQPNPVDLSLEVALDPLGLPLSGLRSTLHAAVVAEAGDGRRTISLRPGERLDRDFVLRFSLAGAVPATVAALAPDGDGDGDGDGDDRPGEGTYAVTVVPPAAATATRRPLDVAVVLDRSGSMNGWKMVAARRAAARIVDTLDASDRVVVIGFDDRIEYPDRLGRGLVPAGDQARFAAVEFLARLDARGGTEIHQALDAAASAMGSDRQRDAVIVLVTDGQIAQEDHVLRAAAAWIDRVRIFTVGIDRAVNAGFLQRLADAGRGRCELVETEDALDEAMTRIHRAVATPVVLELSVSADGLVPGTQSPHRAPDCYPGAPVVLSGRYRGARPTAFTVTGTTPDGARWIQTVEALPVANRAVRTAWARAHVRNLEDRYLVEPGDGLAKAIVDASLAHGVLSRFTAFVAVDHSDSSGTATPHPVLQPVELPSGWAGAPMRLAAAGAMPMSMAPTPPVAMAEHAMAAPAPSEAGEAGEAGRPAVPARPKLGRFRKGRNRPTWNELAARLRDLLATPPLDVAEFEAILPDLEPAGAPRAVREAVTNLIAALRSATAVDEKADALRRALDGATRKSNRFWQ